MSQAHSTSVEPQMNALTLDDGTVVEVGTEFTLYEMKFVREDGHLVEDCWSAGTVTLQEMVTPSVGNSEVALVHEDGGMSVITVNMLREMFEDIYSWTPQGNIDTVEWDAEL